MGDAVFKEGNVVRDADISVDADTGAVNAEAGYLYLRGAVRPVDSATLTIPTDCAVAIGVRFTETIITELEDQTLRDPAVGTSNYQEPGAARRLEAITWGWEGGGQNDGGDGQFHAVATVTNGVLDSKQQPPALDAVIQTVARYDRCKRLHVASGLDLTFSRMTPRTGMTTMFSLLQKAWGMSAVSR